MRVKFGCPNTELAILCSEQLLWPLRQAMPHASLELLPISSTEERSYTRELEQALREGRIDFALHALKDLPTTLPEDLPIVAYTRRADPRDCLVLAKGLKKPDLTRPIGCSSRRRQLELKTLWPTAILKLIHGDVSQQLADLDAGLLGAVVLSAADLQLLQQDARIHEIFSIEEILPAAGQGILVIQACAGTDCTLLESVSDSESTCCAAAERAFVHALEGCSTSPAAAYARIEDDLLILTGMYVSLDETDICKADIIGQPEQAHVLGHTLAQHLKG